MLWTVPTGSEFVAIRRAGTLGAGVGTGAVGAGEGAFDEEAGLCNFADDIFPAQPAAQIKTIGRSMTPRIAISFRERFVSDPLFSEFVWIALQREAV